ncbi:MAG: DUF4375 domain-containing protein [Spirochaetaceae bacterium]|nr:DUF4375 domain-containing protein [Spirochaetaceae bacterium]
MYHEELDKINDRIYEKIASDDNSVMCKNVKKLDPVEKTVFCAYQYYLKQMNDGFMAIFTGYMSPLVFEIREALKEINAKTNLEFLNLAIKKVNVENKSEADFLTDIENEELEHLYDEETEEEYCDYLRELDSQILDKEDIQDLIFDYWKKSPQQK